ncbi:hypothetical protein CLIB1444_09S03532 [[Candida] jaroonii]|uniref:Uncharacterized protein n=1 Tax=[Candida] jaroonii TaxID=467808 RepID=A0ACA9YC59_9ASCO|nr:hypothetical protein CLIB1444_09S03532 [[Candida] jaroonii]
MKVQNDSNLLLPSPSIEKSKPRKRNEFEALDDLNFGSPKRYSKVLQLMDSGVRSPIKKIRKPSPPPSDASLQSPSRTSHNIPPVSTPTQSNFQPRETPKSSPRRKLEYITSPGKTEKSAWGQIEDLQLKPKVYEKSPRKQKKQVDLSEEIYEKINRIPITRYEIKNAPDKTSKPIPERAIPETSIPEKSMKTYSEERSYLLENDPFVEIPYMEPSTTISISELKQMGQNNIIKEEIEYFLDNLTTLSSEESQELQKLLIENGDRFYDLNITMPEIMTEDLRPILTLLLTKKLIKVNEKLIGLIKNDNELMNLI